MSEHMDNAILNHINEGIQVLRAEGDDELADFYQDLYRFAFLRRREEDCGQFNMAQAIVCRVKALRYRVWHTLATRDGSTESVKSFKQDYNTAVLEAMKAEAQVTGRMLKAHEAINEGV